MSAACLRVAADTYYNIRIVEIIAKGGNSNESYDFGVLANCIRSEHRPWSFKVFLSPDRES
jgi:hypothetical protein